MTFATEDIVERLRGRAIHPLVLWRDAEAMEQAAVEIERLRAAGDKVAHTLSVQSEWTCCADGWFGPCGCPPDVATRPTDDSVATAFAAWEEARREQ